MLPIYKYTLIIILVILLIIVLIKIIKKLRRKIVPHMKRPFLNIYTDKDVKLNIVFITHPFTRPETIKEYENAVDNGVKFLGMSSYSEFPGPISNPFDLLHDRTIDAWKHDYFKLTKGWCHCFREPDKFIPKDTKKILLSESDFANFEYHKPDNKPKQYDFLYICLKDNDKCEMGWQGYNRNWEGAQKCLDIMCKKYGLKGLIIGRINCKVPDSCHNILDLTDFQEYATFIQNYNKCKFIFVPNTADASPRVMTEAMCYKKPILVNKNIVGGWKYVTEETGEDFIEDNFEEKLDKFIKNLDKYKAREYFIKNYGAENSGKRLLQFIKENFNKDELNLDLDTVSYLKPGI